MYHFFVSQDQIGTDQIRICGSDVNHIRNVLRMKPGEEILVSDEKQNDYYCVLEEIAADTVTARISFVEEQGHELPAKITLFQGLPKGDKLELIIQKAVELGAAAVVPVSMKRSVVKLDEKKAQVRQKRWQSIAESAAKQSKRSQIPEVSWVLSFAEMLEAAGEMDLFLAPYEAAEGMAATRRAFELVKPGMRIGVLIGPEGGFDEEEIRAAKEAGALEISLGRRILRTETAGFAVLSALMLKLEEME